MECIILIPENFENKDDMLLEINKLMHGHNEYHMQHIQLVKKYALLLNERTGNELDNNKLSYSALAHDIFKERGLNPSKIVIWNGHEIPQDNTRYVRTHLNRLEELGLDEFFNTDIQYHALAAGIFVGNEFHIKDLEVLYPIFFHSCPIIEIYETLPSRVKKSIDIIMLADKLSSNWLRINMKKTEVRVDLDLAVFGNDGYEFNYTLGLFLARMIGQGNSTEEQSQISTKFYYDRLCKMNPMISKHYSVKRLGGASIWPERNSQAFKMR